MQTPGTALRRALRQIQLHTQMVQNVSRGTSWGSVRVLHKNVSRETF